MSSARFIVGDSLTVLRTLPDASVDLVLTSPPFLALRSYLAADDPNKAKEIGGEPTPGEFIDALMEVVAECRRVLAPHGSLVFELGDTFAGSGGGGGDYNTGGLREGQERFRARAGWRGATGWPLDKSLCLVPEIFRLTLAYGVNPLTGATYEPWRVRNVVRWCRPNPPVGALGDKFRPATSDMVIACVDRLRYFDLDAVRTEHQWPDDRHLRKDVSLNDKGERFRNSGMNAVGAPPLDWWKITTQPYKGSHYATWPEALLTRPILAMSPARVCLTCGKPSERIVERSERYAAARAAVGDFNTHMTGSNDSATGNNGSSRARQLGDMTCAENVTVGWTDCDHDSWRPGVVLDPFAGSGTTLAVATGHSRDAIGIDLDERNADLARERVGMFLTVEHHEKDAA